MVHQISRHGILAIQWRTRGFGHHTNKWLAIYNAVFSWYASAALFFLSVVVFDDVIHLTYDSHWLS